MKQQKRIEIMERALRNDLTVIEAAIVLGSVNGNAIGLCPSDWRDFSGIRRGNGDRQFQLVESPFRIPSEVDTPERNAVVCCYTPPR